MLAIYALGSTLGGLLYRIRGGWLKEKYLFGSTQLARLVWSLPTGFLLFWATTPDTDMWYRAFLCTAFVFASMALLGHGAHMFFDMKEYRSIFFSPTYNRGFTELLTELWLPKLFGGTPTAQWTDNKIIWYNFIGMTVIGIVRHSIVVLPFCILTPWFAFWYVVLGATHAGWYLLGALTPRPKGYYGGIVAEFYVGFTTWLFILVWWFK